MSLRRRVDRLTISERTKIEIPIELIFEILLRLPAKSVAVSRCVSKLWGSLISRQDFAESYLSRSLNRPQILFTCEKDDGKLFFFSSPQVQNPDEISSADSLVSFSSSFIVSRPINGLVCLQRLVEETNGTTVRVGVICNPSTGQCLRLPKPSLKNISSCFFLYEPIEKQYKVLLSCGLVEYLVLTLGTGELSWRNIECPSMHRSSQSHICINGVLYYPAIDFPSMEYIIVCFDVSTEMFGCIRDMEEFSKAAHNGILFNYNGTLASLVSEEKWFVDGRSKSIELWVFVGTYYIKYTYVLPTWWQDIVGTAVYAFVGVTGSNEIMLSPCYHTVPFYVFYFNIETKTMRRVAIRGMEALPGGTVLTFLDHVENVKPILMF